MLLPGAKMLQYVDNVLIYTKHSNQEEAIMRLIKDLENFCIFLENGLKLSSGKSTTGTL